MQVEELREEDAHSSSPGVSDLDETLSDAEGGKGSCLSDQERSPGMDKPIVMPDAELKEKIIKQV